MNKKALIKRAAFDAGLSVKNEQKAVEAFLCAVSDILKSEKEVIIPDFGRFTVKGYGEHNVRHPQTGETITVPPTKRVRFKPFGNIFNYRRKYGL